MKRALVVGALVLTPLFACKREPAAGLPGGGTSFKDPNVGSNDSPTPVETQPSSPHGGQSPHGDGTGTAPPLDPSQMGQTMPPNHGMGGQGMTGMGSTGEAKSLTKNADGTYALGPFSIAIPAEWSLKPVKSSMRAAQIIISDKAGEEGEIVVYYFGAQGAGSVQDNLDRWLGQFAGSDGKPAKDGKVEKVKFGGFDATVVSTTGHFSAESMTGGPPQDTPDGELLAAIVDSPDGPYYFKGTGVRKTMDAAAPKFRAMLESLKVTKK